MITIIGDSHSLALYHALDDWSDGPKPSIQVVPLINGSYFWKPFAQMDADGIRFIQPQMATAFRKGTGQEAIHCDDPTVWGLCIGHHSPWLFTHKTWFRFTPAHIPQSRKHAVSSAVIRQALISQLQHVFGFYAALKAMDRPFFVISSPPPPPQNWGFHTNHLAPSAVFLDQYYRTEFAELMVEQGIAFLSPPAGTADENGMLLPEYHHPSPKDQHHGNAAYGALVIKQIVSYAQERHPEPGFCLTAYPPKEMVRS